MEKPLYLFVSTSTIGIYLGEMKILLVADDYSLVLLDLMIPKKSGIEVMKAIREKDTVPILIISARDTDSDKTLGLGLVC